MSRGHRLIWENTTLVEFSQKCICCAARHGQRVQKGEEAQVANAVSSGSMNSCHASIAHSKRSRGVSTPKSVSVHCRCTETRKVDVIFVSFAARLLDLIHTVGTA